MVDIEQWLREDDAKSRPFRAQRAREMMAACPIDEAGVMVSGGEDTMTAFVEARLAYVNGLYLCTVLSALAVLERHFTARLYGAGLESAKRMSFDNVLRRALQDGGVTADKRLILAIFGFCEMPMHISGSRATVRSVLSGRVCRWATCSNRTP